MNSSSACAEMIVSDMPLADRTWFGLGGCARYWSAPDSASQLQSVVRWAQQEHVPVRVLGRGANVLVADDGFDGLVIRLEKPAFTEVVFEPGMVRAGGGADLMKLAGDCAQAGLAGLECMAGIPGTVGGAIAMNAGGRFGQIGDVVHRVQLLRPEGRVETVAGQDMGFGYRRSNVGDSIVVWAELRVEKQPVETVKARFHRYWQIKKQSQPLAAQSAGCMFKNPPGDSAGRLIDAAGLKGASVGRASVSRQHANFIVTDKGATAADVLALARLIQSRVKERFGVSLEMEVDVWMQTARQATADA